MTLSIIKVLFILTPPAGGADGTGDLIALSGVFRHGIRGFVQRRWTTCVFADICFAA